MTASEFIIWLRGFAAAANTYNITPKQWDELKSKLDEVQGVQVGVNGWGVTTSAGNYDVTYSTKEEKIF